MLKRNIIINLHPSSIFVIVRGVRGVCWEVLVVAYNLLVCVVDSPFAINIFALWCLHALITHD